MPTEERPVLFLDVETTGIGDDDRLCQLAYTLRAPGGEVTKVFENLFRPPVPMGLEATSVCHITQAMLDDKPAFKGSNNADDLQAIIDGGALLVAHNAEFDLKMLAREGVRLPEQHVCTYKVAHHLDVKGELPRHTLQYLRYLEDLQIEARAHDAAGDVAVLIALFDRYRERLPVSEMAAISAVPILLKKMPFGKYRARKFEDIVKIDYDYLLWLRRNVELETNLRYTVDYWIKKR